MANRLVHEKSPYLLQHAKNPVDWYPWGEEALGRAKREGRPILLSVGYSACHWCHVMERESFEDEAIAAIMNEHFVNIKVDREERPDIDHVYQTSAQLLTGQGGWPLTVFLTPDRRPFYAGTYFPPYDRYGRPGFVRVLHSVIRTFKEDQGRIEHAARQMTQALARVDRQDADGAPEVPVESGEALVEKAVEWLLGHVDFENGGFGTQPKFPNAPALALFLRRFARRKDEEGPGKAAFLTLDKMAAGGIYDHLGGGFHRYATDARWLVPHFEKMLYDNALLSSIYLQAYQLTKNERYANVVRETLAYVDREMSHPEGGFYSAQDADSEGEEGAFFVWRPEAFDDLLGPMSPLLKARFGVTAEGNFERGATVLHIADSIRSLAAKFGMSEGAVREAIARGKERLFAARSEREKPATDDKVILAWNALMISAYALSHRVLHEPARIARAKRACAFIEKHMVRGDRLVRSYREGPSSIAGFADDYIYWVQALIDMYEATFDRDYLLNAGRWMDTAIELFWDDESPGFFLIAKDQEQLLHRPKDWRDQSLPSANGVAASVLQRLHPAFEKKGYGERAERLLETYRRQLDQNPWGTGSLVLAYEGMRLGATEIVFVARDDQRKELAPLLEALGETYAPHAIVHVIAPEEAETSENSLWRGKGQKDDRPTAYVCRGYACSAPVTDAKALVELIVTG